MPDAPPKTVPIRAPDGSLGTVPESELGQALDAGAKLATPNELAHAENEARYGGAAGQLAAGAAGVARGATLGLSDVAGAELGGADYLGHIRETNPGASLAGEVVGALAPALVGDEAGLAGLARPRSLGQALTLPGRAVGALGRSVEAATGSGLARTAIEGAAYGAGGALTEASLGPDHDLTAEKLAAGALGGALFGGAAHVGMGALGATFSKGRDLVGRYAAEVQPGAIEALAERHFGEPAEGLGNLVREHYARASAAASGADVDAIRTLTGGGAAGREARRLAVYDAPKVQEEAARAIRAHGDELLRAGDLVADEAKGALKAGYVAKAVKTGNEAETAKAAKAYLRELIDGAEAHLANPEGVGFAKSVETVSKSAYRAEAAIDNAVASGKDVNAQIFTTLDGVKRDVQRLASSGYRAVNAVADPVDRRLAMQSTKFFDESAEGLRKHLEDVDVWGKAAEDQIGINRAWTRQIDASKRFHGALTTDVGRNPANPYVQMKGIDPTKAERYVKGLTNANQDLTHQAVKDYLRSTQELSTAIHAAYELPPAKVEQVRKIHAAAKAFEGELARSEKSLVLANQFEGLRKAEKESGLSALSGLAGGLALGGPVGAVGGALAGAVAQPGRTIAQLAAIERIVQRVDRRIDKGVSGFLRGKGSAPTREALARPERTKAYEKTVEEIAAMAGNPTATSERVGDAMGGISGAAPNVSRSFSSVVGRAVTFLASKIPANHATGDSPLPQRRRIPVSDAEMETLERAVRVVRDPTVVVHDLEHGRVTQLEVDALREVYPKMYGDLRQKVFDRIVDHDGELPYTKVVQLGILFDSSGIDPTLDARFVRSVSQTFPAVTDDEESPNAAPVTGPARQVDLASAFTTPFETKAS